MARAPVIPSAEVIRRIAAQTDRVCLSFSGGRDSMGAWVALRPHFREIIPIYHYLVPDLEFVEEGLARAEEHFKTRIRRVPHPILYQLLDWQAFQPPERVPLLEWFAERDTFPRTMTLGEIKSYVLQDEGLPNGWIAVGTRAADSTARRRAFAFHGAIRKNRTFYPIWDLTRSQTLELVARDGLELPADYPVWGRSFDGIDLKFLAGLREHFPRDYERVLQWFPLVHAEFARKEVFDATKRR